MGVAKNKELVGVGATARVFIGEEFAVKVISSTRWMPKEHINTEANFLLIAQHCPYAAGALEIGHIEDLTFIVMHKARGSELFYATRHEMIWDHSSLKVSGQLTFSEKVVALLDMALGMQWLHDRGIIHRDINLSNAITDEDGHSKIIDFGFSKWIADQERGAAGTPNFASPEVYVGEVQGAESDIYSFGATIHALLTNTLILGHPNQANRDIHVDREFYKILLKSAWEKIIFPKAYQEFDQMNRGPLRSSVDNILSEMEKAFLGNLKEDFIQKIETDNKIPDFIKEDVLEILGRIWPNIIQMQECILAVQEKIASIVSGCFKREPSQRIKDDVLVKELQTLQMLVENVIKITI
jgi:serine/threonine protein kinase